jgi:hypothetical protein
MSVLFIITIITKHVIHSKNIIKNIKIMPIYTVSLKTRSIIIIIYTLSVIFSAFIMIRLAYDMLLAYLPLYQPLFYNIDFFLFLILFYIRYLINYTIAFLILIILCLHITSILVFTTKRLIL